MNIPLFASQRFDWIQRRRAHGGIQPEEQADERGDALARETAAPSPARFFAYPGGKHSRQAAEALRQAGYDAACTIRPVLAHRGGDPFSLPRSVILGGMPLWQVMARASRAADWHRALRHQYRASRE